MRAALVIAAKDLRQKLRDRSVLLMAVAAPLGLAFLFSTMIPDQDTFHTTYAVVDLDRGEIARGLVDGPLAGLAQADVATLVPTASEAEARAAVKAGDVAAAIVIPAGFSTAVQAGQPAQLLVIGGPSSLSDEVARSVLVGFGSRVTAVQVAVGTVMGVAGASPDPALAAELAQEAAAAPAPIAVTTGETADRSASSKTFYGASMAVLFVFFAAQFGVLGLLAERRNGTLARMLAAPIAPATILLGKVLVSLVVASISMTVIVLATTLLMGADWGDPVAVAALVLAVALAATGIATLIVGFAKNEEQAGSFIAVVAMTLAVFGGSFFRMSQAPEGLAALSVLTPHAWFLRAIDDLAGGGGIAVVVPSLLVLTAVGLVTGGIGLLRARQVVVP
jgi:linearmycin/streptolysin S transport system permease protein